MGGAFTALADGACGQLWNPGAVYDRSLDIVIPEGSGRVTFFNDFFDRLFELKNILGDDNITDPDVYNDIELVTDIVDTLWAFYQGRTGATFEGAGGAEFASYGVHGSARTIAKGASWVWMDLNHLNPFDVEDSISKNESELTTIAMAGIELAGGYAHPIFPIFFDERDSEVSLGARLKYIRAKTFFLDKSLFLDIDESASFKEMFNEAERDVSAFGADVGVLWAYRSKYRFGLAIRDLFNPSFEIAGTQFKEITVHPSVRFGAAWLINPSLTVSADIDLTENETVVPFIDNREIAFGAEKTLFNGKIAFRGGVYDNVSDPKIHPVITGGFGIIGSLVRMEVAGGYDFDYGQVDASFLVGFNVGGRTMKEYFAERREKKNQ